MNTSMTSVAEKQGRQTAADNRDDGKIRYGGRWRTPEQIGKIKDRARKDSKERTKRRAEERKSEAEQAGLPPDAQNGTGTAGPKTVIEKLEWVLGHLEYKRWPGGADEATRNLWTVAKKDKHWFVNKFLPMLLKRKETGNEKQDIEYERQDRRVARPHEEWMERQKWEPCPACKGTGIRALASKENCGVQTGNA
jgi:hypothetical protein